MHLLLSGIAATILSTYNSCSSSHPGEDYKNQHEAKPSTFDGNFKGVINKTSVSVSLKNNEGKVTGTYKDPETSYSISGEIDANGHMQGKMENGLFSFNCTAYYEGYSLVLELDKEFIALMKIAIAITGNTEDAVAMESKLLLEKQ